MKFLVAERLRELYKGSLPREADALGIVKAVIANRCLERDEIIPGTSVTPDEVVRNGLVQFKTDVPNSDYPSGYLEVPFAVRRSYENLWVYTRQKPHQP